MDVVFSEFCSGIEISLTECRPATAAPIFHKRDFEPERLEHFDCRDADVRFVVAHKCVIPKDDVTTLL
jgi:hypothetical protein